MDAATKEQLRVLAQQSLVFTSKAFDATATWVGKLSWWKFFIFAILLLSSGAFIQKNLIGSSTPNTVKLGKAAERAAEQQNKKAQAENRVAFDNTGIRIKTKTAIKNSNRIEIDGQGWHSAKDSKPSDPSKKIETEAGDDMSDLARVEIEKDNVHIRLPHELAQELRMQVEKEVDAKTADAAAVATDEEKIRSSEWFQNFVVLLVFGLFGMKALMGGKVRAEEKAKVANAFAEREALMRQVSEAQMQMMQAQVEPHFLFNTLASVEFLIETDPPRAAAMQRSLISYLRAVLPQMREKSSKTNLGREVDIVKSYLDLLKMRMEERLNIDFILPENLRKAAFPPMMLQSIVENAIKHGLECKEDGGTLQFRAELYENRLRVTVRDDGVGFGAIPSNGTGLGLQNIRERLKLLYKGQAQLTITANQPSGVCVMIEIPYDLVK